MTKKAIIPAMIARPTMPAITPPTIAPTFVFEPEDELPLPMVGTAEAEGVEVAEGPAAEDSGAPDSAMS